MRTVTRAFAALLLTTAALVISTSAQINSFCAAHAASLYCRIPTVFGTTIVNPLQPLDQALATQLTLVPLASPASGIVYMPDPATKLPVQAGTETFGPVFSERGETLYARKLFIAGVYQRFRFDSLDGVNLKQIPMLFYFCNTVGQCGPIAAIVRVDAHLDQYAIFATYGATAWLDASVAVPILRVSLAANGVRCTDPTKYCSQKFPDGSAVAFSNTGITGWASGFGDVVLRAKASLFQTGKFKFAAGIDVRVPSGDALNFLGAGSVGVKPFEAFSRSGRLSPHVNVAYQWNGISELAGTAAGEKGKLPEVLSYAVGIDSAVTKNLTVSADYLGEHIVSVSRLAKVTSLVNDDEVQNTTVSSGSFETVRGALGFKWKPFKQLLVSGNVLGKFDHNGLHHTGVPLFGISYTF